MDNAATPLTGKVLNERYLVGPRIASGGMAVVYEGTDTRLERRVALKVMHTGMASDPVFVESFVREARSAAALSHPNIVAVHDQGTDSGEIYLVMEFVTGSTLRDLLRARGRLSVNEALDVLEPVLDALSAAHAAGLAHRDVKPENILITSDGRIKVADFGLARAVSGATQATRGVVIGTVAYLAPEQVQGGTGNERSDVYSAGVLLFEMLTGKPPYDGDTPAIVAVRHVNEDVPAPSQLIPGSPAAMDALVAGATNRDPSVRYSDAQGFLAAVRATRQRLGLPAIAAIGGFIAEPTFHDTLIVSTDSPVTSLPATSSPSPAAAPNEPERYKTGVLANPMPAEPAVRQRSRKGLIAFLLVITLAVAAGAGAWALGRTPQVVVPKVVGLTELQAKAALSKVAFTAEFADDSFSETVATGKVISSDPVAGAQADEKSAVTLTLSKGPERYTIPNLAKRTVTDAEAAITGSNLIVGTTTQSYNSTVGKGLVVSTSPKAGSSVKRDTVVNLIVSQGPEILKVPNVTGQTSSAAQSAVSKAGFKPAVTLQYSESVAKGVVISQSPSSGTAARDSTLKLVVSNGPPLVAVPNIVSKSLSQATSILSAAGFKISVRTNIPGGGNIVVQQVPGAGSSRPKGSTIVVDVF
ncbi:MAG: Stk1 family PASTA domain-containing Ser/Thr kinase [Actinomycetes bacterium]